MLEEFETLSEQVARLTAECERLREENGRLQRLLSPQRQSEIDLGGQPPQHAITETAIAPAVAPKSSAGLSVPEKIAIFRSLFRGREDVFAIRWESADGKSGYSPASVRDWKTVMNAPPAERKKLDQATRRLLPLTDEAIHQHLSGKHTIGVYPLLTDETCWFLAVDFDQHSWKLDAVAFLESCREMSIPAALDAPDPGKALTCGYSSPLRYLPNWRESLAQASSREPCNEGTRSV